MDGHVDMLVVGVAAIVRSPSPGRRAVDGTGARDPTVRDDVLHPRIATPCDRLREPPRIAAVRRVVGDVNSRDDARSAVHHPWVVVRLSLACVASPIVPSLALLRP